MVKPVVYRRRSIKPHPIMSYFSENLSLRALFFCCLLGTVFAPAIAQDDAVSDTMLTAAGWAEFSSNLRSAIASDNEGARVGALSQIIRHGQYLDFDELTVFEVMRMYRDSKDPKIRRMAVVALGNMNNRWAIEFLDMLSRYEENETIKSTMERVVKEHRSMKSEM
jgi:hypothetical protein